VPGGLQVSWLLIWVINNISVTLINKASFASVDFHYPYTVRAALSSRDVTSGPRPHHAWHASSCSSSNPPRRLLQWQLSAIHMLVCSIAANAYFSNSTEMKRKKLDRRGNQFIYIFSFLFAANIAIGNVSLRYVSVNFNQVGAHIALVP
jgi:hypothetical protein